MGRVAALCLIIVMMTSMACSQTQHLKSLSIDDLNPAEAKRSGARLISLIDGLHFIGSTAQTSGGVKPRFVLTHGYGSRGYEWIYAAKHLARHGDVYFYRWNWAQCPQQGGEGLLAALDTLVQRDAQRPIEIWGHSYGGVITAVAAARYRHQTPLIAHVIAAPVAGHPKLEGQCTQSIGELTQDLKVSTSSPLYGRISSHVLKIKQWRTLHHLDGAFKNLKVDPQVVQWRSEVTRLPEKYRGRRLGHNWSISWVVDQNYPPASH